MDTPIQPGIYQHYKGNFYEVLGEGRHSEDPSKIFVIYKALYENKLEDGTPLPNGSIWIKPKEMFVGCTEDHIKRFAKVNK